jgi:hypothetical protein
MTQGEDRVDAYEYLEREAGCDYQRAQLMAELQSAAEATWIEWCEVPEEVPADWLAAVRLIAETEVQVFNVPA